MQTINFFCKGISTVNRFFHSERLCYFLTALVKYLEMSLNRNLKYHDCVLSAKEVRKFFWINLEKLRRCLQMLNTYCEKNH
mgnify:FL=1